MTIIEKQSKTFTNRFILSLKSFHITVWLYPFILVIFPVFMLLGYREIDNVKLTISIILGVSFVILLLYLAFKQAENSITKIVIGDLINIEVNRFDKKQILQFQKDKLTYITRKGGRWQTPHISFLIDGKVVLSQYTNENYWSWNDIESLESKLKQLEIKKPYGDNL